MISKFRARRIILRLSHDRAVALLKTVARTNGFDVSEATDLQKLIRRRTGTVLRHKVTLLQIQKPSMMLSSVLMDDIMPLLLPLRLVVREEDDELSVLHFADWDVAMDSENSVAQHCMDMLYLEMVSQITATLRESFKGCLEPVRN